MILYDHRPQEQLGQFILGSSYVGGRSSIIAAETRSIATGDADVVFFLDDSDTITSARTAQFRAFQTLVDLNTIQETNTKEQYSFVAILSNNLLNRTESISILRLVNANTVFPSLIERQTGLLHTAVRRAFGQPTITNFLRNTFVSETLSSVMPFIVTTQDSLPIGAGTVTTAWSTETFTIHIDKNLQGYEDTLAFLGYNNTYIG